MTMTSRLKASGRALIVALALGGAAVTAAPAQAAPADFSFSFSFGNGYSAGRTCLSDREVRRSLRRQGFEEIRFIDRRGRVVTVRAERGRRDFRVTVDSCTGRILDVDRIRRR